MSIARHHFQAGLVFILGLALSLLAFYVAENHAQVKAESDFVQTANGHLSSIERIVSAELNVVKSIVGLHQSSDRVDREEFRAFINIVSLSEPAFQALEWIPRVPNSEREAYEQAARKDGYAGFRFTERSSQGDIVTAAERAEYFPVYYVEPYKGNEAALGFDLGSDPVRLAALERARDTGKMVSSAKIRLVQSKEDNLGILLFAPIYGKGKPHETVQQRRANLTGFSLGVVRVSKLFFYTSMALSPSIFMSTARGAKTIGRFTYSNQRKGRTRRRS